MVNNKNLAIIGIIAIAVIFFIGNNLGLFEIYGAVSTQQNCSEWLGSLDYITPQNDIPFCYGNFRQVTKVSDRPPTSFATGSCFINYIRAETKEEAVELCNVECTETKLQFCGVGESCANGQCVLDDVSDGVVTRTELSNAINQWIAGSLSRSKLSEAIVAWVDG